MLVPGFGPMSLRSRHGQSGDLHKLCRNGNLNKVREFVEQTDREQLAEILTNQKGLFSGYTPLHEAVFGGHFKVVDFLLGRTDADVNCRAKKGYTPLHVAASTGHVESVMVLLNHGADITLTDVYGKTPKQASSNSSIIRLLRSEGECSYFWHLTVCGMLSERVFIVLL